MDVFTQFVQQRTPDLKRIARATRGEQQFDDVVNEAWLMLERLSGRAGARLDPCDPAVQQHLLSHLYQSLVRYTELHLRHAVRLDHGTGDASDDGAPHPLMQRLVSDGGRDPLASLLQAEEAPPDAEREPAAFSLAAAYLLLLQRFDYRKRAVAGHLLISVSQTNRCFARVYRLAEQQHAIALARPQQHAVVAPWRRSRFVRIPRQLAFDFDEQLALVVSPLNGEGAISHAMA